MRQLSPRSCRRRFCAGEVARGHTGTIQSPWGGLGAGAIARKNQVRRLPHGGETGFPCREAGRRRPLQLDRPRTDLHRVPRRHSPGRPGRPVHDVPRRREVDRHTRVLPRHDRLCAHRPAPHGRVRCLSPGIAATAQARRHRPTDSRVSAGPTRNLHLLPRGPAPGPVWRRLYDLSLDQELHRHRGDRLRPFPDTVPPAGETRLGSVCRLSPRLQHGPGSPAGLGHVRNLPRARPACRDSHGPGQAGRLRGVPRGTRIYPFDLSAGAASSVEVPAGGEARRREMLGLSCPGCRTPGGGHAGRRQDRDAPGLHGMRQLPRRRSWGTAGAAAAQGRMRRVPQRDGMEAEWVRPGRARQPCVAPRWSACGDRLSQLPRGRSQGPQAAGQGSRRTRQGGLCLHGYRDRLRELSPRPSWRPVRTGGRSPGTGRLSRLSRSKIVPACCGRHSGPRPLPVPAPGGTSGDAVLVLPQGAGRKPGRAAPGHADRSRREAPGTRAGHGFHLYIVPHFGARDPVRYPGQGRPVRQLSWGRELRSRRPVRP